MKYPKKLCEHEIHIKGINNISPHTSNEISYSNRIKRWMIFQIKNQLQRNYLIENRT